MSENGNAGDGVSDGTGNGGAGTTWGWEPVPHGGEYDSDATAFVKLPPDMLGAAGTGEPLAAPGHGFVPPPMIVPLGSAGTDPAATGTWSIPVQWPEAPGSAPAAQAAPVLGPIPAVIPMPASAMAALHGDAEQGQDPGSGADAGASAGYGHEHEYGHAHGQEHGHESATTAEWPFPEAGQGADASFGDGIGTGPDGGFDGAGFDGGGQGAQTGQWAIPVVDGELPEESGEFRRGGLDADWSQAPATLPGGAAAPWATHPGLDLTAATAADPYADPFAAPAADPYAQAFAEPGAGLPGAGQPAEPEAPAQSAPGPDAGPRDTLGGFDAFGALDPVQTMSGGTLPEPGGAAGSGAGRRVLGGPGVGTAAPAPRGPRVLGGPGVGTPLPEHLRHLEHLDHAEHAQEPVRPAPDIDAAHGAAAAPVTAERPHPAAEATPEPVADAGPEPVAEATPEPAGGAGPDPVADAGPEHGLGPGHGIGHGGAPEQGHDPGAGFAEAGGAPGGAEDGPRETDGGPGSGDPADVPDDRATYDEGAQGPADGALAAPAHEEHPLASYVLRVNGADRPVTGAWIGESLLYVLRERLGLAGAKDGCSQGECGACAVQVDGRLVASCLVPAATAASSEVRTVEGLATDGELSDVQQALCRSGAVQCGFCVPGMAMTIHDLLEGNHAPSELETRQALCGNLCRCSGYRGVIDAVGEVVAEREAAADAAAAGAAGGAQGGAEARIPHQAAPGEGGIHPDHQHGGMA
ncbi:2Fe-2S iron-sulfur cluster-binding protein [Streptomyces sp. NPDC002138]|uniref:2Fe-2S iron-sulfur cluster-binding protein n=1 Tax=Streptomyces sp. NPDC002138 TaxID=3154410 RepID=UPI00331F6BC1